MKYIIKAELIIIGMLACSGYASQSAVKTDELSRLKSENNNRDQDFPEKIYFRTPIESFNRLYYFLLREGKLYIKKHNNYMEDLSKWILFGERNLSFYNKNKEQMNLDYIDQISVDGSQMVVVSHKKIYTSNNGLSDYDKWIWSGSWGHPFNFGPGISLSEHYRAWSVSFSDPKEQKYQTDQNGNKFIVLVCSIYLLSEDGTIIHIADPWTPADWGYQIATPLRGRFIARDISASGSLVFIINNYGDMYTKYVDFDVIGADPLLRYTYDTIPVYKGIFNWGHPRKLPITDWKYQPKIKGNITGKITVYSTGEGEQARSLRVEGLDNDGNTGFYEKNIAGSNWNFVKTGNLIDTNLILSNTIEDNSKKEPGPIKDYFYSGVIGNYPAILEDFNLYCSPCILRIEIRPDVWYRFILHTVFTFRTKIENNPGVDGKPLELRGAIEIPENLAKSTDVDLQNFLNEYLDYKEQPTMSRFIPIHATATTNEINLEKSGFFQIFSKLRIRFAR